MTICILYYKESNKIFGFYNEPKSVSDTRIEFGIDSVIDGINESILGSIVTNDLTFKEEIKIIEETQKDEQGSIVNEEEKEITYYLEDAQGSRYTYGDTLPAELTDISNQFIKPTLDDLGRELALEKMNGLQKDTMINNLGAELASVKMDVIKLKGGLV